MDLLENYQNFFYVRKANTPELLAQAYRLRFDVFVKDCGFKLGDFDVVKETERDFYDSNADHCLLFYKPLNKPIGYFRLIHNKSEINHYLPIENYGGGCLNLDKMFLTKLQSSKTGELSRLLIHPLFRRKINGHLYPHIKVKVNTTKIHRINYLPICLVLACGALMYENGFDYSFVFMEKSLAKLLKSFGVVHENIGSQIECFGKRQPYIIYFQQTYDNLTLEFKKLYELIQLELTQSETCINVEKESKYFV